MRRKLACLGALWLLGPLADADPWLPPGDLALRSDLQALSDAGILRSPMTTWPLAWSDIAADIRGARPADADEFTRQALMRVGDRARAETTTGAPFPNGRAALSEHPRSIRAFEDTPREDAELGGTIAWTGDRFAIRLSGTRVSDPSDGASSRPDGSYLGMAIGNWMLAVGYPERWWGPGWDGSLILSTNARPVPQISINRNSARPFSVRWLRWIGPWSLTAFMGQMDDERVVDDALLFGLRLTARPLVGLEIGLSRTAQWCGAGRPCDLEAFTNLLLGRDNRGVNVSEEEEPGNQLGGIDLRWTSPVGTLPYALYLQWIGEDGRRGGPQIGSWLRQAGIEFWGMLVAPQWRHRTYFEAADTICREGGIGYGGKKFDCAYNHSIYQTGYRYEGRSVGHGIDGDGQVYSVGSTLIAQDGRSWNILARSIDVNTGSAADANHTVSPTPQDIAELSVSHTRPFTLGILSLGVGYRRLRDVNNPSADDGSLFAWTEFRLQQ